MGICEKGDTQNSQNPQNPQNAQNPENAQNNKMYQFNLYLIKG